jgi:hypothetical protein
MMSGIVAIPRTTGRRTGRQPGSRHPNRDREEYLMNALSQSRPIVHYAKVDRWLAALIGGMGLFMAAISATILVIGLTKGQMSSVGEVGPACFPLCIGVLLGLVLWGCYNIRYEITPSDLQVHFGPFFLAALPLESIIEVYPTHNPLSAPAPSLDRLRIDYQIKNGRAWFTLISPKDKEGFVRDLAGAAPRLRSVGNDPLRLKAEVPA